VAVGRGGSMIFKIGEKYRYVVAQIFIDPEINQYYRIHARIVLEER